MKYNATIQLGNINLNGRLYTGDSFRLDEYTTFVFADFDDITPIGTAEIKIVDNVINMYITITNMYMDELIRKAINYIKPTFACYNTAVDDDYKVICCDIGKVFFTPKTAFRQTSFEIVQ